MTKSLEPRTAELVGVAASIAGHCQPCFDFHLQKALELDVSLDEIRAAVSLARAVRGAGDRHMDEHADRGMKAASEDAPARPGPAPRH